VILEIGDFDVPESQLKILFIRRYERRRHARKKSFLSSCN
jgi:lipid II:glycine glycyltransferase (peptidoglycan interpeptide bridge formation enzyme)